MNLIDKRTLGKLPNELTTGEIIRVAITGVVVITMARAATRAIANVTLTYLGRKLPKELLDEARRNARRR